MTIGITGAAGFIGWHLRCLLSLHEDLETRLATRETFENPVALQEFVEGTDVIVHLAGINRAPDNELRAGNRGLAEALVTACGAVGATPHIILSSSTHVERQTLTAYGRGKQEASEVLNDWARQSGARATTLVIPHVYGEYGRPKYNSAVATFCHQLATNELPHVDNDAPLELIHVQDLVEEILLVIRSGKEGVVRLTGTHITVREVLARLTEMKTSYEAGILPDLSTPFAVRLFNTLRSYYYPTRYPFAPPLYADPRGHLFETVKGRSGGQCFVSTTVPGITRGNHFHRYKFERFFVLSGKARIQIRKLFSDHVEEFFVDGDQPAYVDIPTLQTHNITNVGDEPLVTLFWTNEIFDPEHPDTYALSV